MNIIMTVAIIACVIGSAFFSASEMSYSSANKIRLENAKQLLRDTSASILDIAIQVGYEGSDQFIRAFRKNQGMTPNEYRHKYP